MPEDQTKKYKNYNDYAEQHYLMYIVGISALIIPLYPLSHYIFRLMPNAPADSLGLRLIASGNSLLALLIAVIFRHRARILPYAQVLNVLGALLVVHQLIFDADHHPLYYAGVLLAILASPYCFLRMRDWFLAAVPALIFYSYISFVSFSKGEGRPHSVMLVLFAFMAYAIAATLASMVIRTHKKEYLLIQEAQALAQARQDFLAQMSHEIRSPLNSMLGFAQLLREELSESAPSEESESLQYLGYIEKSGNHLLSLVNNLLDLAKAECGEREITIEEIPLKEFADDLIALHGVTASNKGVLLKLTCGHGLPEAISTDRLKLKQILVNLLSNAIKFTPKGTVELKLQALKSGDSAQTLQFAVRDEGPGIPAAEQEKIFQKYRQAEKSNAQDTTGTGLGLAIARELASLLGGRLFVKSTPGQGSTFVFELPLN